MKDYQRERNPYVPPTDFPVAKSTSTIHVLDIPFLTWAVLSMPLAFTFCLLESQASPQLILVPKFGAV